MHPVINIFSLNIPSYSLFIMLGIITAVLLSLLFYKRSGIKRDDLLNSWVVSVIGLLIGGKVLYLLPRLRDMWADREYIFSNSALFLQKYFSGGFVFYGGLILGLFFIILYCRKYKAAVSNALGHIAIFIPLAHAAGRVGCFFAGCCYGVQTDGAIGIYFTQSIVAPNNVPLVPVQLFESAVNFAIFIVLFIVGKNEKSKNGYLLLGLYLLLYSVSRFILEFFRGDLERGLLLGVSTSQIISLLLLPISIGIIIIAKKRPAEQKNENK